MRIVAALMLLSLWPCPAKADDPAFSTDRPTKSNAPTTVPSGMFQYEADTPIVTHSNIDQYNINSVFKLGLNDWMDAELGVTPLISDPHGAGVGDVTGRAKFNLFGNGGGVALALIPYFKIPTATRRFGNGQVEGGVIAPLSVPLPGDFTLTMQPEIDALKNLKSTGTHAAFANVINISHPLFKNFIVYGEIYASVSDGNGGKPITTNDYAIAYTVTPTFQLDGGVNIALSSAAPSTQFYFGVSQRF